MLAATTSTQRAGVRLGDGGREHAERVHAAKEIAQSLALLLRAAACAEFGVCTGFYNKFQKIRL